MKLFVPGEVYPRWSIPARGYGANGPGWWMVGGDTPPGRYRLGDIHRIPENDPQAQAFGPLAIDLIEMEGQETKNGRAGIMIHGGGSGLENAYSSPRQGWVVTHGCVRCQNEDVQKIVYSLIWARRCGSTRKNCDTYLPGENYIDFTMSWVDEL